MFREFLKNNKKRRIGSMFKIMLSKYVLLLAFLLLIPVKSWGGGTTLIPDSDFLGESQLYFPWDLRGRNSFIQVTNVTNSPVVIHVQVFNHAEDCLENSFWDTLTPNDTNVYDLSAIQDDPDGFGFVVVTEVTGLASTESVFNFSLIGNFRIIDDAGYEYRANAAAWDPFPFSEPTSLYSFNFNNRGGAAFSDVIGITVAGAGTGAVEANNQIAAVFGSDPGFPVFIFDDQEVPRDCDVVVFSCGEPNEFFADLLGISTNRINYEFGISAQFPNTKGAAPNICTSSATTGFVFLPFTGFLEGDFEGDFFVGFTGLNSGGSSVGSMDLWWADSTFLTTFNGLAQND